MLSHSCNFGGIGAGEHGMPSVAIELVPGGEFYGLEYLVKECRTMRAVAAQVWAEHPAVVPEADIWAPTWFPLLRLGGKGFVLVNLASSSAVTSPVQVMWHDDGFDQRAIVAWPSITAFVDTVIERFESGEYWVDEAGLASGDTIDFPYGQA